ncbi:MAG: DUF1566 domain-containing protein, partial [Myxococcota bacterium]
MTLCVRPLSLLLAWAALMSGCYPPSHVLLRVEDPNGATADVVELRVRRDSRDDRIVARGEMRFPLTIPLTSSVRGVLEVTVSGLNDAGEVVARVTKELALDRSGTPTDIVTIARVCSDVNDCPNENFCDGAPTCGNDGLCVYAPPCVSDFPCVITSCNEETDTCSLTVDHAECAEGFYCDPGSGCTEGLPCLPETVAIDCDDGSVCNGEERCINFRCLGGVPPDVNDGDVCTLDGCNDDRRFTNENPIFSIPLVSLDGSVCTVVGTEDRGVCVSEAGGCSVSRCGDGVVDDGSEGGVPEVCDDGPRNSEDWDIEQHCNSTCTGFGPFCGDAILDSEFETCDDGSRFDSGNGCSDSCQRNDGGCGDGVVQQLFEQCDDANSDNCDGCRDDCTFGCLCATGAGCDAAGEFCVNGQCNPCDTNQFCGTECASCGGATPVCGGVDAGCQCVNDTTARGSCFPGTQCDSGVCVGCTADNACGQECGACSDPLGLCFDQEVGCVIDEGSDCVGQPDYLRCATSAPASLSFDVCLSEVCRSPGCGDPSCNGPGVYFPLTDSNQRSCFDNSAEIACPGTAGAADCASTPFCGQDAQYGANDNVFQFSREELVPGEPVVASSVTGLMWQGCVAGLSGSSCESGSASAGVWADAVAICEALLWGGYSDWRLPSRAEFQSIQDYSRIPSIDPSFFPATPIDFQWASDFSVGTAEFAWQVSFTESRAFIDSETRNNLTRCVRGTPDPNGLSLERYAQSEPVSGQPIVTDAITTLIWQGCLSGLTGADCSVG